MFQVLVGKEESAIGTPLPRCKNSGCIVWRVRLFIEVASIDVMGMYAALPRHQTCAMGSLHVCVLSWLKCTIIRSPC